MKLKDLKSPVPQDIEIAQAAHPVFIGDIAADLGLTADECNLHGKTKAKVRLKTLSKLEFLFISKPKAGYMLRLVARRWS